MSSGNWAKITWEQRRKTARKDNGPLNPSLLSSNDGGGGGRERELIRDRGMGRAAGGSLHTHTTQDHGTCFIRLTVMTLLLSTVIHRL